MIKPETRRDWIRCPYCGRKAYALHSDTAECHGVYTTCSRGCKKEFEILIRDGKQILNI